jgi:hypothetical protein
MSTWMVGAAKNVLEALVMHILDVDAKLSSSGYLFCFLCEKKRYLFCSNELRWDLGLVEYVFCLDTGVQNPDPF